MTHKEVARTWHWLAKSKHEVTLAERKGKMVFQFDIKIANHYIQFPIPPIPTKEES